MTDFILREYNSCIRNFLINYDNYQNLVIDFRIIKIIQFKLIKPPVWRFRWRQYRIIQLNNWSDIFSFIINYSWFYDKKYFSFIFLLLLLTINQDERDKDICQILWFFRCVHNLLDEFQIIPIGKPVKKILISFFAIINLISFFIVIILHQTIWNRIWNGWMLQIILKYFCSQL